MAIINSPLFSNATGQLSGMVIYKVGNQTRMRCKTSSYHDKKSARQLAQRQKLKECLKLYGVLDGIFLYSWRGKAQDMNMNGCNLFIRENIRNFNDDGKIADWSKLKICAGSYSFSPSWQVEKDTPDTLTLRWEPEPETRTAFEDVLYIGAYGYNENDPEGWISLFRVDDVRANRQDGICRFRIPGSKAPLQLYACFKNPYTGEYTDSVYLGEW